MSAHRIRHTIFFVTSIVVLLPFLHAEAAARPTRTDSFTHFAGTPYSDTAAVIDVNTGAFLYREQATKQRPIASLTKLVTATVFLESQPNLDERITYSRVFDREGTSVDLEEGDELTLYDVLMGTLVQSANNMAVTLSAHTQATSEEQFVQQMNSRMQELGFKRTSFVESTGLDTLNVSTAGNLARLARHIFTTHRGVFISALYHPTYALTALNAATHTKKQILLSSTNRFQSDGIYEVLAFKTGYLPYEAHRTLVIEVRERATGNDIIIVLLGNEKYGTIFQEARDLADWTFANWEFSKP